jgi:hypothetical protein
VAAIVSGAADTGPSVSGVVPGSGAGDSVGLAVGFAAGVDGLAFECRGEAGFSESPISSIHRGTR